MKLATRIAAVSLIGLVAIGSVAAPAFAKGPTRAVIRGPGLDEPIVLSWRAHVASSAFAELVQRSGIFNGLWCRRCPGSTDERPAGSLGPRFTVTYTLAIELVRNERVDHVVQDVYPFAESHPVSFVRKGQPFWGERSSGGWFIARPSLRGVLRDLGIRPMPPSEAVLASPRPSVGAGAAGTADVFRDGLWVALVLCVSIAWLTLRHVRGIGRTPDRAIEP